MDLTEEFWERKYLENISKMIGICFRYIPNRQIAEDLAQDAFIIAIDKSGDYKGKGCFEAWLRKIAVNSALQYLRKQKTTRNYLISIQQEIDKIEMEDEEYNEKSTFYYRYTEKELLQAINNLPEHHRMVFNLYVIDKYTHAEIAKELGISQGTSKSHLARARKKLKIILSQTPEKPDIKEKKKSWMILILPCKSKYIDRLYKNRLENFRIQPVNRSMVRFKEWDKIIKPIPEKKVFSMKYALTTGMSFIFVSSVILFLNNYKLHKENTRTETESVDSINIKKKLENAILFVPQEKNENIIAIDSGKTKMKIIIKEKIQVHKKLIVRDTIRVIKSKN